LVIEDEITCFPSCATGGSEVLQSIRFVHCIFSRAPMIFPVRLYILWFVIGLYRVSFFVLAGFAYDGSPLVCLLVSAYPGMADCFTAGNSTINSAEYISHLQKFTSKTWQDAVQRIHRRRGKISDLRYLQSGVSCGVWFASACVVCPSSFDTSLC
jgi:hypothetical protein